MCNSSNKCCGRLTRRRINGFVPLYTMCWIKSECIWKMLITPFTILCFPSLHLFRYGYILRFCSCIFTFFYFSDISVALLTPSSECRRLKNVFWALLYVPLRFLAQQKVIILQVSAKQIFWSWLRSLMHLTQQPQWLNGTVLQYLTHSRRQNVLSL